MHPAITATFQLLSTLFIPLIDLMINTMLRKVLFHKANNILNTSFGFWICFPTHMYSKISLFPIKFEFRCTYTVPSVLIYQNEMILIINNFLRHASELLKCSFMSVNYILCRERTIQPYDRFIPRVGQAQSK